LYNDNKYIKTLLNKNVTNLIWRANLLNQNVNIDFLIDEINNKQVLAPPTL
jgi:hypothetical protein